MHIVDTIPTTDDRVTNWDWELSSPLDISHTMLNLFTRKLLPVILLGAKTRGRLSILCWERSSKKAETSLIK